VTGAACCKWGQCRGVWGRPGIRRRSNHQGSKYVLPLFLQNVVFETGRVNDILESLLKEGLPVYRRRNSLALAPALLLNQKNSRCHHTACK
jgi:hypothetical protein